MNEKTRRRLRKRASRLSEEAKAQVEEFNAAVEQIVKEFSIPDKKRLREVLCELGLALDGRAFWAEMHAGDSLDETARLARQLVRNLRLEPNFLRLGAPPEEAGLAALDTDQIEGMLLDLASRADRLHEKPKGRGRPTIDDAHEIVSVLGLFWEREKGKFNPTFARDYDPPEKYEPGDPKNLPARFVRACCDALGLGISDKQLKTASDAYRKRQKKSPKNS